MTKKLNPASEGVHIDVAVHVGTKEQPSRWPSAV